MNFVKYCKADVFGLQNIVFGKIVVDNLGAREKNPALLVGGLAFGLADVSGDFKNLIRDLTGV